MPATLLPTAQNTPGWSVIDTTMGQYPSSAINSAVGVEHVGEFGNSVTLLRVSSAFQVFVSRLRHFVNLDYTYVEFQLRTLYYAPPFPFTIMPPTSPISCCNSVVLCQNASPPPIEPNYLLYPKHHDFLFLSEFR